MKNRLYRTTGPILIVIAVAMLMSVFERIHELGVMRAIGVTPWQLTKLVYAETMVQVGTATAAALVLGWPVSRHFETRGIDLSAIAGGASFGGVAMDPILHTCVTARSVLLPAGVLQPSP